MGIPFQIPLKPHIKKYLLFYYPEPYKLDKRDSFGHMIYLALREQRNCKRYEQRTANYSSKITVLITHNYVFNNRLTEITPETVRTINLYIDSMIKDRFIDYMILYNDLRDYQVSIDKFIELYNFTDDEMKFDCLKQHWFRFRKAHPDFSKRIRTAIVFNNSAFVRDKRNRLVKIKGKEPSFNKGVVRTKFE
jgi:hypothetical protein